MATFDLIDTKVMADTKGGTSKVLLLDALKKLSNSAEHEVRFDETRDCCERRHNRMLHRPEENQLPNPTSTETVKTNASVRLNTFGMLPVYQVELSNNGKRMKVLALIDNGSILSWINKSSVDQLNLQ